MFPVSAARTTRSVVSSILAACSTKFDYQSNLGDDIRSLNDGRCCRFLGIEYRALAARTLEGGTDKDILAWAHAHGTPRNDEECVIWNRFMTKAGWRDDRSARLQQLVVEYGLVGKPIETVFHLFDYDEGRDPIC